MRLRNLILSLFLAAGAAAFTACEGERGPVGEAGPAGTAGAAGAKGETGDAGKSSEEIPSAYDFLKTWGKADGMAACSDDIFDKMKMAAFPGPATLGKAAGNARIPLPSGSATTVSPAVTLSPAAIVPATHKGQCSGKVFAGTAGATATPFTFTPTQVGKKVTETKRGTTAVLGNTTLTTTETESWGGMVAVDLKPDTPEAEGMDRLAVRCNVGKRPVDTATGGNKTITGEYRIVLVTETENLLAKDDGDSTVIKDSHPANAQNDYELTNYTTHICIRLASVPGTVKCYVRTAVQERDTDDTAEPGLTVTEQMALHKDGKLTQVMPVPYSSGRLAGGPGTGGSASANFPFGNTRINANLGDRGGKLCNFFTNGVVPCPAGEAPNASEICQ